MKAMLFAAGLGTRLKPFTDNHPKALAPVNGKPLLEHTIRYLQRYGIYDVVVNVHHFADQIIDALAQNNGYGSSYTISDERDEVLETGGGLKKAAPYFANEEAFVVMNVDVLTNLQLDKLIAAHQSSDAIATLAIMQRDSSRNLLFNEFSQLCGWRNNTTGEEKMAFDSEVKEPFAFSGIQVLSPAIFDMPFESKFSIIDVYLHFAKDHIVNGYDHTGDIFLDVGKPETLAKASELFKLPDFETQNKEGKPLMMVHFALVIIALLNFTSRITLGVGLHVYLSLTVKVLMILSGVALFFIYRKPFKKRALYFFNYVFLIVSSAISAMTGGIMGAVILSFAIAIFWEQTEVQLRADDGYVVYEKFSGFFGNCCRYNLYRNEYLIFQKWIGSVDINTPDKLKESVLAIKNDTAYLYTRVMLYSIELKRSVEIDTVYKIPLP